MSGPSLAPNRSSIERCPRCKEPGAATLNSRPCAGGRRRSRRCPSCEHRWTTTEISGALARRLLKVADTVERCLRELDRADELLASLREELGDVADDD